MQAFVKEASRLKQAQAILRTKTPYFGVNKKREITRLFYEISKRENIPPQNIAGDIDNWEHKKLKQYLLQRRFPQGFLDASGLKPYLPAIKLRQESVANSEKRKYSPRRIFVEKEAASSSLLKRFKAAFPQGRISEITLLKDYLKCHRQQSPAVYNQRRDAVFIVNEHYDFFRPCPCTKGAAGCGYHIFSLSFGCIYDCAYCYLQEYVNQPGIIFCANPESFFDRFTAYKRKGMRIGTGEFSDSLICDEITQYSLSIVDFFRRHPEVIFEFKTKSDNIGNLLQASHGGNIVVSWSVNPQKLIEESEFFTSSLKERINAALKCIAAGYRVGFHFDPMIYFFGWEKEYVGLIDYLFSRIKAKEIAWMSIGTLRFNPALKPIIEARFPQNKILDEELTLGFDNKLRYPLKLRYNIYKFMLKNLTRYIPKNKLYLCMEEAKIGDQLKI